MITDFLFCCLRSAYFQQIEEDVQKHFENEDDGDDDLDDTLHDVYEAKFLEWWVVAVQDLECHDGKYRDEERPL